MDYKKYQTLLTEIVEPGIMRISLNRPERLNSISRVMLSEMLDLLDTLRHDLDTRVIILTGEGEKGFCGGLDIKEEIAPQDLTAPQLYEWQTNLAEMELKMRRIPQPIICAVHGAAAGGGFSFALASDIRIITPDARFSAFYINVGLGGADMGSSYFLPRLIGAGVAYDLLLTGRFMDAREAVHLGFVSECVEREQLMEKALEKARLINVKDALAIRLTKEAINQNLDCASMERVLNVENRNQAMMMLYNMQQGKKILGN